MSMKLNSTIRTMLVSSWKALGFFGSGCGIISIAEFNSITVQ